ncbi:Helix-turn-helix [uncultured Clostridium sp.]|nr:Helix-turn-helix [uncultured Clostridium sp.]
MNSIKKYEDKNIYPTKEVSNKLAAFFKLDTKYFYDSMYEEDINISITLNTFMNANNLSIKSLAKLINISQETVSNWLSNKQPISRKSYNKLKELGILS